MKLYIKAELEKLQNAVKANGFGEDGNKQADVYLKIRDLITSLNDSPKVYSESEVRELMDRTWEAAETYGRDQVNVLKPEGQIYPDKEAFLDEMFTPHPPGEGRTHNPQ